MADSPVPAVWGSQGEKRGQGTGLELPCVPRLMQEAGRQRRLMQLSSHSSRSDLPTGAGLGRRGAVLRGEEGRGCPRPRSWLPRGFWGARAAGRAPTGLGIVWAGGRRRQRWPLGAWWAWGSHVGRGKHGGHAGNFGLRPETPPMPPGRGLGTVAAWGERGQRGPVWPRRHHRCVCFLARGCPPRYLCSLFALRYPRGQQRSSRAKSGEARARLKGKLSAERVTSMLGSAGKPNPNPAQQAGHGGPDPAPCRNGVSLA